MKVKIHKVHSKHVFPILGWMIRLSQRTKWHHYVIHYGDKVTDAKRKGIRRIHENCFFHEYKIIETVEIDIPEPEDKIDIWVSTKLGTKYGFFQLFGIALISLGLIKRNPFGEELKYLVCHEYCLVFLERFLKVNIGDSDDYDFRKADIVIDTTARGQK